MIVVFVEVVFFRCNCVLIICVYENILFVLMLNYDYEVCFVCIVFCGFFELDYDVEFFDFVGYFIKIKMSCFDLF